MFYKGADENNENNDNENNENDDNDNKLDKKKNLYLFILNMDS